MLPVLIQLFDLASETDFPRRLAVQRLHKWSDRLFSSIFAVKTMWEHTSSPTIQACDKNFICQLEKCVIRY